MKSLIYAVFVLIALAFIGLLGRACSELTHAVAAESPSSSASINPSEIAPAPIPLAKKTGQLTSIQKIDAAVTHINRNLPQRINDTTRLDDTSRDGLSIVYHYTALNLNKPIDKKLSKPYVTYRPLVAFCKKA
jgi:hypothetical protein